MSHVGNNPNDDNYIHPRQQVGFLKNEIPKCQAIKHNGKQCTYNANSLYGNLFCGIHKKAYLEKDTQVCKMKYLTENSSNKELENISEEQIIPTKVKTKRKLKVFEAFAGYGGTSFALKKLGYDYEIVGYSEIDKYAIQLYNKNHPGNTNFGNISDINEKLLPDFDLFTGGFPCQPFSSAGLGLGEKDDRGILFLDILRIVAFKRPEMILLENVKGLLTKRHISTLDKIKSELEMIGYCVCFKLLNTKDYGIPQNRERVWIFASHRNIYENFDVFPTPMNTIVRISNYLDINPEASLYLCHKQIERLIELCGFDLDSSEKLCLDLYNKKIRTDGICMTLGGVHNTMRIVEPKVNGEYKIRKMSIMEQFRLMGFDDNEIDYSGLSYTRLCHIVSNGWDINVVSLILGRILSVW